MKLNTAVVALIVGALSAFGAGISYAGEHEKHVTEALTHTQSAVDAGKKGTASAVGEHAKQALEHAKQAEQAKPDAHITEAETHLSQAIDHAAQGHADIAANHVQEAARHLKMAYGGTAAK
jgi:HEPN domain-containing protein